MSLETNKEHVNTTNTGTFTKKLYFILNSRSKSRNTLFLFVVLWYFWLLIYLFETGSHISQAD